MNESYVWIQLHSKLLVLFTLKASYCQITWIYFNIDFIANKLLKFIQSINDQIIFMIQINCIQNEILIQRNRPLQNNLAFAILSYQNLILKY